MGARCANRARSRIMPPFCHGREVTRKMLMPRKQWRLADLLPAALAASAAGIHPAIAQVLYNRGQRDVGQMQRYLAGRVVHYEPLLMAGMPEAVERIVAAIVGGERIAVYGDFDADGVTATALLVQALDGFGADVRPYIPNRVDEGYGVNSPALDRLAAEGIRLIITVDCGIRSFREAEHAAQIGLDLIVTDHHAIENDELGADRIPRALAVVSPRRDGGRYPFAGLAGVGIAFKLAQALYRRNEAQPFARHPVTYRLADLVDLVALGTVSDLAPLVDENRYLVTRGLAELRRPRRPGLQAMIAEAGLRPALLRSGDIAFKLGPRLNAAGRLESADKAYDLLMAADGLAAMPLAGALGALNLHRQKLTEEYIARAEAALPGEISDRSILLVAGPDYPDGIVGLVAGKLAEAHYRPALVFKTGDVEARGSARSVPGFDVTAALDECRDLLVRHGGHAQAAGCTVRRENLQPLFERLVEVADRWRDGRELTPVLDIDAELSLAELDFALVGQLDQLQPFGSGNPEPVFLGRNLEVVTERPAGADHKHLKLVVRDQRGALWDAICFGFGACLGTLPKRIDLAFALERNEFGGNERLELRVRDIRPTDAVGKGGPA